MVSGHISADQRKVRWGWNSAEYKQQYVLVSVLAIQVKYYILLWNRC